MICRVAKIVLALWDDLKSYELKVLINNAGFGDLDSIMIFKNGKMIDLNVFTCGYFPVYSCEIINVNKTQLINVLRGWIFLAPGVVTYCKVKFCGASQRVFIS